VSTATATQDGAQMDNPQSMELAAKHLRLPVTLLQKALLSRTLGDRDAILIPYSAKEASHARDAFSKALYAGLFNYLGQRINHALKRPGCVPRPSRHSSTSRTAAAHSAADMAAAASSCGASSSSMTMTLGERELSRELFSTPPDTNRGLASANQPDKNSYLWVGRLTWHFFQCVFARSRALLGSLFDEDRNTCASFDAASMLPKLCVSWELCVWSLRTGLTQGVCVSTTWAM